MSEQRTQSGLGFLDYYDSGVDDAFDFSYDGSNFMGGGFDNYYAYDDWWNDFTPTSGDNGSYWLDIWDSLWPGWDEYDEPVIRIDTYEPYALPTGPTDPLSFFDPWFYEPDVIAPPVEYPGIPYVEPGAPTQPNLPPYCPSGTYHPYPIGHPQQDVCVPFPTDPAAKQQAQKKEQQRQQQQQQQQAKSGAQAKPPQSQQKCPTGQTFNAQLNRCIPVCPKGQIFDPRQNKCIVPPQCPSGLQFNPQTAKCEKAETFLDVAKGVPWWIWALGAVIVAKAAQPSEPAYRRRRS